MRIAIRHPFFIANDQTTNFNGYDFEFVRLFKPVIYITGWRRQLTRGLKFRKAMRASGLEAEQYEFAFTESELNRKADAVVCFNGFPYLPHNEPPAKFNGLKIWHVMDYVWRAAESNRILENGGVNYVMGYADHGKYCPFFQKFYPGYVGKTISVPFGYGKRFENKTAFAERCRKALAVGSVRPVNDPSAPEPDTLRDYIEFYKGVEWTHQWRRTLALEAENLRDVMDSQLPLFPETENPKYNAVEVLNQYAMFANDEGLMAFPPARTYEGTAAGAVLVGAAHGSYADLGFVDGVNCILHRKHDLDDFRAKVSHYIQNPDKLEALQKASVQMARSEYSHEQVARNTYAAIEKLYRENRG